MRRVSFRHVDARPRQAASNVEHGRLLHGGRRPRRGGPLRELEHGELVRELADLHQDGDRRADEGGLPGGDGVQTGSLSEGRQPDQKLHRF